MTESLRDLERAAQDGLLDPVRLLAELDRRGALSRGREIRMRARGPLPEDRVAALLARSIPGSHTEEARVGFMRGYIAGFDPITYDLVAEWERARVECNDWLFRGPRRATRGVPVFNAVMRDLAAIDAVLDAGALIALDGGGYYVPFRDERGSVIGVAVLNPDRVGNGSSAARTMTFATMDRIDREHPGAREILRRMQESARPMPQSLAALNVQPLRDGSLDTSKAERAREKTRANVRRRPPRFL